MSSKMNNLNQFQAMNNYDYQNYLMKNSYDMYSQPYFGHGQGFSGGDLYNNRMGKNFKKKI